MNAMPLTAPDGRILAYACGRCGRVRVGVSAADLNVEIAWSRDRANTCCVCSHCGKVTTHNRFSSICELCDETERARREEELSKRQAERQRQDASAELTLATARDKDAAIRLRDLMSDISEKYYAAVWLDGLETDLWDMLQHGGPRNYGLGTVTDAEITELLRLHEKSGGWFEWNEDAGQAIFVAKSLWTLSTENE